MTASLSLLESLTRTPEAIDSMATFVKTDTQVAWFSSTASRVSDEFTRAVAMLARPESPGDALPAAPSLIDTSKTDGEQASREWLMAAHRDDEEIDEGRIVTGRSALTEVAAPDGLAQPIVWAISSETSAAAHGNAGVLAELLALPDECHRSGVLLKLEAESIGPCNLSASTSPQSEANLPRAG